MEYEEWRPVVLDGITFDYEISDLGNLRRTSTKKHIKGHVASNGYVRVTICDSTIGFHRDKGIHQLVMNAFNPSDDPSLEINHEDADKSNNRLDNLTWMTHKENMNHAKEHNLFKLGEDCGHAKYDESDVIEVCKLLEEGNLNFVEISEITGMSKHSIRAIANRRIWKHVSDKYDFSNMSNRHHDHRSIHNSLDRAIISGVKYSKMVSVLMEKGLTENQAQTLIYQRRKRIKKGESIVQCTVYIDEGEEIF